MRTREKMADIMVAMASHDLRTPLNTIISMHEMVEQNTDNPNIL